MPAYPAKGNLLKALPNYQLCVLCALKEGKIFYKGPL